MCPDQTQNQTFIDWMKAEVEYANSKNIEVSAYTLLQMNGWGESVPEEEQTLDYDGKRGPTACMATDFHGEYRADVLNFVQLVGLTGIETDGEYESIPCTDDSHDHHHNGVEGGYHYGLMTTLSFNENCKALGLYHTGADAYVFSGVNRWNHADTDAFGQLPLWQNTIVGRFYVYDSTLNRIKSSGQIGVGDLSERTKEAALKEDCGYLGRVACFDFVMGTYYLLGTTAGFHTDKLVDPNDTEIDELMATMKKWTDFYKQCVASEQSDECYCHASLGSS